MPWPRDEDRNDPGILHADLDAFFASVEQRDNPSLRGRPVIVGPGVVLAASYEAKAYGVRTAMGANQALRLCPHAVVAKARFSAYVEASKAVFEIFHDVTPLVEGLSIDEAFLDVRGLRRVSGPAPEIAARLRQRVLGEVGLPITVGIASTKFLAKVASAVAKPDGLLVVPCGGELDFLHPLPVERLWGVGQVTAEKLRTRGITTVAEVARLGEPTLVSMLGLASGRHLHHLAHNRDPRAVVTGVRRRSIGSQSALGRRHKSAEALDATLVGIVDRVTHRMRAGGRVGRTVVLRLRFDDYTRATRSHTLPQPTAHTDTILLAARGLLESAVDIIEARGVTLVGLAVSQLFDDTAVQLALPFDRHSPALDAAVDGVKDRFGSSALTRAVLLGQRHDWLSSLPTPSSDRPEPAVEEDLETERRVRLHGHVGQVGARHVEQVPAEGEGPDDLDAVARSLRLDGNRHPAAAGDCSDNRSRDGESGVKNRRYTATEAATGAAAIIGTATFHGGAIRGRTGSLR